MSAQPRLIVDLHAHLFNARCLPLAGIIANAMGKSAGESLLARITARLLNALTEAEYSPVPTFSAASDPVGYYIEQISQLTVQQLNLSSNLNWAPEAKESASKAQADAVHYFESSVESSEIYACLAELESCLVSDGYLPAITHKSHNISSRSDWARKVVSTALRAIESAVVLKDEIQNYAEFFLNMLTAESRMAETLIKNYGGDLPPLQIVHHMMDMQMAYVEKDTPAEMVAPKYSFFENQLLRMQTIQRRYDGKILGFAAFDPRRSNWREIALRAIAMGFIGFKFYPAMGYKPINDSDPKVRQNIEEFFRFCIERDIPIFTHCTPTGFETRHRDGLNANPELWAELLAINEFSNLRLCFGHGGGGHDSRKDGKLYSGWFASDLSEWKLPSNFARVVSNLCKKYQNVYCELAYLTELIEGSQSKQDEAIQSLQRNLAYAMTRNDEEPYDLMKKIAYGSDWHMPSMVRHPREYLNIFLDMFGNPNLGLSQYREQFFWENAYHYLKFQMH